MFETARLGIGVTTLEEALVMTRPHPRRRIDGSTAAVTAIMEATIASNSRRQVPTGVSAASDGAGPPVLFTRMSIGPR